MRRAIPAVVLILICAAGRADAQDPPPRIAVGFGVGNLAPVATDSNGSVPYYAASVRIDFRRHTGVENDHQCHRALDWSGLGQRRRRVRIRSHKIRDARATYSGCSSPICNNQRWSRNDGGITLGATGGVDAIIVSRISGFGSLRATVGYTGRGADVAAIAGIRVRVM